MAKKVVEGLEGAAPNAQTPLLYADGLTQLGVGPYVSRAVIGTQVDESHASPAVVLVMPTNAMLQMAKHIVAMLSDVGVRDKYLETHTRLHAELVQLDTKASGEKLPKPTQQKKS